MLSLLSHRNTENISEKKWSLVKDCIGCIKRFSGRVSLVLGLTMASNPGLANTFLPDSLQYNQEASTSKSSRKNHIPWKVVNLPKKSPILSKKNTTKISSILENISPKPHIAKAKKWDSVGSFMLKNFGTKDGWEGRLVNIETGDIVLNSYKDLKAGATYAWAQNIDEAITFTSFFKEQKTTISKKPETLKSSQIPKSVKTVKTKKSSKHPNFTHSSFVASEETFFSIARSRRIPESQIPNVIALTATLGHQESRTNYNAKWQIITSKSSRHYGTRANGRYQIMEKNWEKWSTAYFGKKLPPTPENQDKVAFSEISNRYQYYYNKGLDVSAIVEEVGKDWYGRWRPDKKWHPTTTQYATAIAQTFDKFSKDFPPKFSVVASNVVDTPNVVNNKISSIKKVSSQNNTPKPTIVAANEPRFDKQDKNEYATDFIFDGKQMVSLKKGSREDRLIGKIYKEKMLKNMRNNPNITSISRKFEKFTQASDFIEYYRGNIRHFEERKLDTTNLQKLLSGLKKDIINITQQARIDSGNELQKAA